MEKQNNLTDNPDQRRARDAERAKVLEHYRDPGTASRFVVAEDLYPAIFECDGAISSCDERLYLDAVTLMKLAQRIPSSLWSEWQPENSRNSRFKIPSPKNKKFVVAD